MRRRQFNAGLLGLMGGAALAGHAAAKAAGKPPLFYAGVGSQLYGYAVDPAARTLVAKHGPVAVAAPIQVACQNPRTGHLYVATSDGANGKSHAITTFAVGRDGALTQVGAATPAPERMIHMSVDHRGEYLLTAYPVSATLTVHRLARDGSVVGEVKQNAKPDVGNYPHQIRAMPSNRAVLVMCRGVVSPTAPEKPGSIRLFSFKDGQLALIQTVAPKGGIGFRPRNTEFSPSGRLAYAALEAQNLVATYAVTGDRLSDEPLSSATTLAASGPAKPGQQLSGSRLHPNGRTLYVVNRGTGTEKFQGETVANGGEDSVAVFAIDPRSGEPRLAQSMPIAGVGTRGIDLSADGRWLVVAGMTPGKVRAGDKIDTVPEALLLFSLGADGRLTPAGRMLSPSQDQPMIWTGAVAY